MLSKVKNRLLNRGEQVQFEFQIMNSAGGWENFAAEWGMDEESKTHDDPPDPPSFGPDTGWPPRRYRCVKRVNGRYNETVWSVEHPGAEDFYEDRRKERRQRDQLKEMAYGDARAAIANRSFDALSREELQEILTEKRPSNDSNDDEELSQLERQLLWEVVNEYDDRGEGAKVALEYYRELR